MYYSDGLLHISEEGVAVQLENLAVERRIRILHRRSPLAEQEIFENGFSEDAEGFAGAGLTTQCFPAEGFPGQGFFTQDFSAGDYELGDGVVPAREPEAVEVYLSGFFRKEQEIARMLLDLTI